MHEQVWAVMMVKDEADIVGHSCGTWRHRASTESWFPITGRPMERGEFSIRCSIA